MIEGRSMAHSRRTAVDQGRYPSVDDPGNLSVPEVNQEISYFHRELKRLAGQLMRTRDEAQQNEIKRQIQKIWLQLNEMKHTLFAFDIEIQGLMEFCELKAGEPEDDLQPSLR